MLLLTVRGLIGPRPALFAYVNNGDYKRAESLKFFADGTFRQDIISNNLRSWIMAGELSVSKSLNLRQYLW